MSNDPGTSDQESAPSRAAEMVASGLLTIDQAAAYLQISRSTLERWRDARLVPYIQLPNGRTRFSQKGLDAWIETRHRRPRQ